MYKDKWTHTQSMGPKSTLGLMRILGPSLASLAQSSWSFLSNALEGQDCIIYVKNIEDEDENYINRIIQVFKINKTCKIRSQGSHKPQDRFRTHGLSMSPLIFVYIRLRFHYFWALYLGFHNVGRVPQKCRIFHHLYFRAPRLVFVLGVVF